MMLLLALSVFSFFSNEVTEPIETHSFDNSLAPFSISYRGEKSAYVIQSAFLLPGEKLELEAISSRPESHFTATMNNKQWPMDAPGNWVWTAHKEPGLSQVTITNRNADEQILLNLFILEPFSNVKQGVLNGYHIGKYPDKPLRGNPVYLPPRGFVEYTANMSDIKVSPHFTLGQFVCKQNGGYPKYLALRTRLLLKLEHLLQLVNQHGYTCTSFNVMSGFRTPYYNKSIGNVKFSRHQWGDAADIFIDESPKDGYPDDLNGDNKINRKDAQLLYDLMNKAGAFKKDIGGLGLYGTTANHGPFVHVDVRGFRARWGN